MVRWKHETPEGFRFCPKIPRSISHEPHLDTRKDDTLAFVERMRGLDTRPIRTGTPQEQRMLQAHERKPNLPLQIVTTTDFAFVRYIGHPKSEVNAPFLDEWVQQCAQWLTQSLTLYVFCHCPFEVYSPNICLELYVQLTKVFSLPALPWQEEQFDKGIEQGHLF